jgi:hypothetical protein
MTMKTKNFNKTSNLKLTKNLSQIRTGKINSMVSFLKITIILEKITKSKQLAQTITNKTLIFNNMVFKINKKKQALTRNDK